MDFLEISATTKDDMILKLQKRRCRNPGWRFWIEDNLGSENPDIWKYITFSASLHLAARSSPGRLQHTPHCTGQQNQLWISKTQPFYNEVPLIYYREFNLRNSRTLMDIHAKFDEIPSKCSGDNEFERRMSRDTAIIYLKLSSSPSLVETQTGMCKRDFWVPNLFSELSSSDA